MFGKGLYFADMSSKSANYCYPTPSKNTGLVLLSEVSFYSLSLKPFLTLNSGCTWSMS
jgi:hypothetical protein